MRRLIVLPFLLASLTVFVASGCDSAKGIVGACGEEEIRLVDSGDQMRLDQLRDDGWDCDYTGTSALGYLEYTCKEC